MYKSVIDCSTVAQHLTDPEWIIVDCRYYLGNVDAGRNAYLQTHIMGAVYADLHHDLSGPPLTDHGRHPLPSVDQLVSVFERLGISNGSQVVAYDDISGAFAARLWWLLQYLGHESVAVIDGGWQSWLAEQLPTGSGVEENPRGQFTAYPDNTCWITAAQVNSAKLLVDSRDPARYRGENEPLDPAAGHIPGAINHFWKNNLAQNGLFLRPEQIAQQFNQFLGQTVVTDSVFYCGSGVTACHNLLAATYAGFPMPRLYAGSWSDWCSDPTRPVATGNEAGVLN